MVMVEIPVLSLSISLSTDDITFRSPLRIQITISVSRTNIEFPLICQARFSQPILDAFRSSPLGMVFGGDGVGEHAFKHGFICFGVPILSASNPNKFFAPLVIFDYNCSALFGLSSIVG